MKNVGHTPRTITKMAKIIIADFMKEGASVAFSCLAEPRKTWLRNLRAYAKDKTVAINISTIGVM
jgi:hypothetical protein